jgi:signal peptidase I
MEEPIEETIISSEDVPSESAAHTEQSDSKNNFRALLWELIQLVLIALVTYFSINAISERIKVESISMQPSLEPGDLVIVNRLAYRLRQPQRGDIVVFEHPTNPYQGPPYIKRILGVPGDTVEVAENIVSVNGTPLNEPFTAEQPNYNGTWEVPDDSLFVLGDNRNRSSDSHIWGMVPIENVIGKAVIVYWPPGHWQIVQNPYQNESRP